MEKTQGGRGGAREDKPLGLPSREWLGGEGASDPQEQAPTRVPKRHEPEALRVAVGCSTRAAIMEGGQ